MDFQEWQEANPDVISRLNTMFEQGLTDAKINPPINIALLMMDGKLVVNLLFASAEECQRANQELGVAFAQAGFPFGSEHPYRVNFLYDDRTPVRWKLLWKEARCVLVENDF